MGNKRQRQETEDGEKRKLIRERKKGCLSPAAKGLPLEKGDSRGSEANSSL